VKTNDLRVRQLKNKPRPGSKTVKRVITFLLLFAAANCMNALADEATGDLLPIGNAEIRTEKDAVYFRLRAPKKNKTEYGLFRYVREGGLWESLGTVASFNQPVALQSGPVTPENFFYPRNGYQELKLSNLTYKIECIDNKVTISVKGGLGPDEYYLSPEVPFAEGNRAFRFRYLTPNRLWFDMRIENSERTFSAGIGYFDLTTKTVGLISPAEMEPEHGKPVIVSELSGNADDVWVGLAYCNEPTCLENGIVLRIGADGKIARRWYSGEKGLPDGAVIRVMPDGDSLWVVTAKGIALIGPDFIQRFQISRKAAITEGGKFGFTPGLTPLPVTHDIAAASARILEVQGNHFRLKPEAPTVLWISEEANRGAYADATGTIKLKPGKTITFLPAADPNSPTAKFTIGSQDKIILKVDDRQPGLIGVEMPDYCWYAPDAVKLQIEEGGKFPANNFMPGAEPSDNPK
jgi:hypothetical protein